MDGRAIQTLGYAFNINLEPLYNEISVLSFDVPAHVDGQRVPGYEKIVGMQIVDMIGAGQFIVNNPDITESAIKEIKSVKAYSLEYEFTFKKITLTNSTYNFWNPAQPDNTIIGIILEKMPSWSVGEIDESLVGKYRTFEVANQNLYDLIKGTLQDSYGCIFDFDTINRKINVRDVSSKGSVQPVYISLDNLAKEISIQEQTENIFTCLDVNGAEGVSIRSVNPTGTNAIYDLGYFMTTDNFEQSLIDKWNNWVQGVESRRQEYYNLTVENALLHMQIATESAALGTLQGELKVLETQMAVEIEAAAQGIETDLSKINEQIAAKKDEIAAKESHIATLNQSLENSQSGLTAINNACKWSAYGITAEEEMLLNRYIKEDAIEDSSFVAPAVDSYMTGGNSFPSANVSVSVGGASISGAPLASGKMVYSARGGTATITVNGEVKLSATLVQGAFDYLSGKGTVCLYTEKGCATISGAYSLSTDCAKDSEIGGDAVFGSTASILSSSANVYITEQLTEYSKKAVEWDLYEYGREVLNRLASPSYSFSVDSGNFLSVDEFDTFRKNLKLGDKLYLNLGTTFGVLQPVLVGASIDFEDKKLLLEFSSSFSLADSAFKLADLLDQSVSMGKSADLNKYNYNAFVNAGGTSGVQNLMDTMRDVSLNGLYSSGNQAWTLDDAGFRLRKYLDETHTNYDPKQIWMTHNMLAFTRDNWNTVVMAMGNFVDKNLGELYGFVAPNIVGTLLAGKHLVIESEKKDGGISVFRVDADGAKLYNSQFDLANEYTINGSKKFGQISLNPSVGIVAGSLDKENNFYSYDKNGNIVGIKATDGSSLLSVADIGNKAPLSNFWVDNHGDVYLKGSVYADKGVFKGDVYAANGEFTGKITATSGSFKGTVQADDFLDSSGKSMLEDGKWSQKHLSIKSLNINDNFVVDESGNVQLNGDISWGVNPIQYQYAKALDESGNAKAIYNSYTVGCIYRREKLGDNLWGEWYQFIGQNGRDGKDGENGIPGVSNYFHVKYSDDGGKTFTSNNGETLGNWIGTCVSEQQADPSYTGAYSWRRIVGMDGAEGKDGESCYFYVKFSPNANGIPMSEEPDENTKYMGVCSTSSPIAPTEPSQYTWTQCRGKDGKDGEDGVRGVGVESIEQTSMSYESGGQNAVTVTLTDGTTATFYVSNGARGEDGKNGENGTPGTNGTNGVSSYFHVKYSDDGKTFTANNGEALGDYMGTCVTETKADPTDFNAYTWKRTTGLDGAEGKAGESCYFYVKFSEYPNGYNMTETPDERTKYMGVCSTNSSTAPTSPSAYTWTQCRGEDGERGSDASVTHATMLAAAQEAFKSGQQTWISADEVGSPVIYGGDIYGAKFHGNEFNIYPSTSGNGSLRMHNWYAYDYSTGEPLFLNTLTIEYGEDSVTGEPYAYFWSGNGAGARWDMPTTFHNNVTMVAQPNFLGGAWFDSTAPIEGLYAYGTQEPEEYQASQAEPTIPPTYWTPRDGFVYFQIID